MDDLKSPSTDLFTPRVTVLLVKKTKKKIMFRLEEAVLIT